MTPAAPDGATLIVPGAQHEHVVSARAAVVHAQRNVHVEIFKVR